MSKTVSYESYKKEKDFWSQELSKSKKEIRELRAYLREIKNGNRKGDYDCGLNIPEGSCPVIDCSICLATFALKRKRPKFSKWRKV